MKKTRVASLLAAMLVCTSVFSGGKIPGSYAATKGQELPEDAEDSEKLGFPTATGSDAGLQTIDLDGGDKMRTVSGPMLPDQTQDLDISVVPIDSGGDEKYRFSQLDDSIVAVVVFGRAGCGLTTGTLKNIKDLPKEYADDAKFVFIDLDEYEDTSRSVNGEILRTLAQQIPDFDVCNDTLSETYSKYTKYYNAYMNEVYEESGAGGSFPHVFMVKGGEIVYHTIKGGILTKSAFTQQLDKLLGKSEETEKPETVDFAARKKAIQDFYKEHPFDLKKPVTYDEEPVLKDNEHTAGKVSQDSIQNGLNALNFVRFVAGLSSVEIDENLQDYTQKGAVLMHSINKMSHTPSKPDNMQQDFYDAAYKGTSESNIAWGSMEPNLAFNVIEQWMEDGDAYNITRVGHRRWCLNPEMAYTGFGYSGGYSAMYSFDSNGTAGGDAGYIPWPAEVMPYEYFKGPWSVSLDREVLKLDSEAVVVTLDYEGKQYTFSNTSKGDGTFYISEEANGTILGCGSTIIFDPNVTFNANSTVNVTVAGIKDIDGNEKEVQYTVRFFDMSDTSEDDNNGDDNNGGNDNDNTGGDNNGNDNNNTGSDNNGGNDNNNTGSDNNGGNDNNNTGNDNNGGNNNNNTGSDNNGGNNNNNTGSDNNGGNNNNNTGSDNNGGNNNNNTGSDNNGGNNNNNTGSDNNGGNNNNNNTGSNNGNNNNTGSDNNNGGGNTPSKPIPAINWRSKSKRPSNTKPNTQTQSNTNNTQSSLNKNQPSASKRNVPSYVSVGAWTTGSNGSWKFTDESGMPYVNRWAAVYNPAAKDGQDNYGWFRFDEKGDMITGWLTDPVDGMTYYMNPISDGTMGQMMTGWVTIDGKEYYFNPESDGFRGRMYRNETTPDGHFVDANGVKVR